MKHQNYLSPITYFFSVIIPKFQLSKGAFPLGVRYTSVEFL